MNKTDMKQMRWVLRHISTSDPDVRAEALRLDAVLERLLQPKPKEEHPK